MPAGGLAPLSSRRVCQVEGATAVTTISRLLSPAREVLASLLVGLAACPRFWADYGRAGGILRCSRRGGFTGRVERGGLPRIRLAGACRSVFLLLYFESRSARLRQRTTHCCRAPMIIE